MLSSVLIMSFLPFPFGTYVLYGNYITFCMKWVYFWTMTRYNQVGILLPLSVAARSCLINI